MTISQKLTSFVRGASFAFLATALLFSAGPGVAFAAAPVALGDSYTATINTPLSVNTASGVLANDTDDLGPLAATAVVAGATSQGGVYDLSADGSFVYTPLTGFTGVDTFAYEVNDAALEGPSVASVEITVEDPSVANVDTEVELEAALANPAIETINITDDIVGITNTIVVDREVTIQGGGNTLTFSGLESATPNDEAVTIVAPATINNLVIDANLASTTSWVGTYGLQVYNSTATLSDITVTGANGGMYANNSTVVLSGTITVSGNGFGGIESSGASASLDVSGASLVNTSEAYGFPTIWEDGLTGTTVVNYGSITRITKGVQYQYYLSDENSKIPQIITFADPVDVIYGDASSIVVAPTADSGLTVSVTTSGTCTNTDFTIDFSVVGTCTVTASQAGDSEYAPAADVVQSFAIAPRPITVLAIAADKEYDTTTSSSGVPILSGTLATGDDAVYTQTYADENVNPGITLTPLATITNGGDNVNSSYAITYMTASGSISAVSLTPTTLAASKTYDGDVDTTATPSVTPLSGDDVTATYVSAAFDTKDVGTLKTVTVSGIALDGAQAGNYTLTSTTAAAQANITQALLSAEVTVDNKVYDNTTAATINGYTPVGLVGIEDVTINGGVATFDTEHVGNGKIVSVSGLNLVADSVSSNYSFTDIDITTADITERAITVTAVTDTKVYDATTASAGVPVITGLGLAAGDTTGFSQVFDDVEAGTGKTLSAEGAVNDGNNGDNYAVTLATALGTVTKAPLTITADNKTKVYGTANPIATATYTGFMGGEDESVLDTDVTLVIVANSQTDVNNHPITAFGAADDNYAITHVNGNLGITKLPITALVVADDKVYDGTTDADVALTLDGVLFADVVTVSNTGADFDTQDVGTLKTVTASGITLGGADAGNYSITATATDTADITVAPLSVTALPATKVYGDSDPEFFYTSTGLMAGDSFAGALGRTVDEGEDVGFYAIDEGSLDAGSNYGPVVFTSANLDITPAPLTITANDQQRTYGDANPTLTVAYSGLVDGEDEDNNTLGEEYIGYTVANQSSNAGTYNIDVVEDTGGFGFSSIQVGNYNVTLVSGTLTINRADQEITFDPLADMEFGDADFDVAATSDSGEDVVFIASGACTVSGVTVHLTSKGTCTITASVPVSTNYNAAVSVDQSFAVADVNAPVITLTGASSVTVATGDSYSDQGATATDDVDGTITSSIVTVNPVNTDVAGTYTVTYNVTDGEGNAATEVSRTVVVERRSSGGGGGGSRNTDTEITTGGGRVLGAALYFFATDLTIGASGADVMELQKVLIEAGYLKIAAPTGYFGPMTAAAVKLYQSAKGIQATGYVGPLTRAALNLGTAPKTAEEQIADLTAQLKALQALQAAQ